MKMKKTLSLILTICLIAALFVTPATARFNDVASDAYYRTSIERLANLGIIGGVGDGNFSPYTELTRAQFARIATIVAGFENEVIGNASARRFTDVEAWHWANGYINTVARHGIITGYPAGDYRPDQAVNFGEAVTIVLRLLGWDHEDLGHNWPFAYVNKARELGLIAGIEQNPLYTISRANIAVIIDRALNTEMNARVNPTQDLLITRMDFRQSEETIVFATRAEDSSLMADEIRTPIGTFRTIGNLNIPLMARVRLILNNSNQVVDIAIVSEANSRTVTIANVFSGGIAYTTAGGASGSVTLDDHSTVYHRGRRFEFSQLPDIQPGSEMVISYTNAGTVESILIRDLTLLGPVVVRENVPADATQIAGLQFQPGVRVIRDGFAASLTDIARYDVVYFAQSTNTLHVYIDKVSGVYERAYPNKAAVSSIVLSGRHLQIETQIAAQRLGENPGSFPIGARFTALLGRDGGIVDVVNMTTTDLGGIVVILSVESRLSTDIDTQGRQDWITTVMTGNGNIMEFRSARDFSNQRGNIMRLNFDGELATFSAINSNPITGVVNQSNRTLGGREVSRSARIIEITTNRRHGHANDATARLIDFTDIPHNSLTSQQVLHTEVDTRFGDITLMIVQNITMAQYTFGYMTHIDVRTPPFPGTVTGNYTIILDGVSREFTTQGSAFTARVGPVAVRLAPNGALESLRSLEEIRTAGRFEAIDFSRIRMGGQNFNLATDVQIYRVLSNTNVTRVSLSDFERLSNVNEVRIFTDTSAAAGGLVRIITFR